MSQYVLVVLGFLFFVSGGFVLSLITPLLSVRGSFPLVGVSFPPMIPSGLDPSYIINHNSIIYMYTVKPQPLHKGHY